MTIFKALTINQPYASALVHGWKRYETRTWKTNYRGLIAIHASKRDPKKHVPGWAWEDSTFAPILSIPMYRGCILAIGNLVDIHLADKVKVTFQEAWLGNYISGFYAWEIKILHLFTIPVMVTGKQGLWNWTPEPEIAELLE